MMRMITKTMTMIHIMMIMMIVMIIQIMMIILRMLCSLVWWDDDEDDADKHYGGYLGDAILNCSWRATMCLLCIVYNF